jgi:capsular exopolysaccharide synthesis family protein
LPIVVSRWAKSDRTLCDLCVSAVKNTAQKEKSMAKTFEALRKSTRRTFRKTKGKIPLFSDLPPAVRLQFEKLKSNLVLGTTGERPKSILFSSYSHGEGTSTVVVNFVESLAQDRKYNILMIDANTRTPGLQEMANSFVVDNNMVFSDLLDPDAEEPLLPKPSNESNLFLVPSGSVTYHPSQIFDHVRFAKFIKHATEVFDFVVFDSSPIGKYHDAVLLASHVDGVILVTQAERTPLHELRRAKQTFQDGNIRILGVVLNRRRFYIPPAVFERFLR